MTKIQSLLTIAVTAPAWACLGSEDGPAASSDAVTSADSLMLDGATTATTATTTATTDDDDVATGSSDTQVPDDVAADAEDDIAAPDAPDIALPTFSFFVTSLAALQDLSGSALGFGGDLRFGETGPGAGLRGADAICATIAERSMPGARHKIWRAFLSAVDGGDGEPVHAIDRIGDGPWYDRLGRVVALSKADLLADRPTSADAAIKNDLPNEDGVPNHRPDPTQPQVDNHHMLTGSDEDGELYGQTATCDSWTGATGDEGRPRVGLSWPRTGGPGGGGPGGGGGPPGGGDQSATHWISALGESGCAPGVNLAQTGGPSEDSVTVGSGGGYGGFYCFALTP